MSVAERKLGTDTREPMEDRDTGATDASILDRVAAGDARAVQECIDTYGGLIWSLARRWCSRSGDAEDAVQDIFIELWKIAGRFDPKKSSEKTFVSMIARRRLIDRLRRSGSRPELRPIEDAATVAGCDATHIETNAEASIAAQVLATLRPEQRLCLELSIHQGMSHGEIADAINLPLGTVKSHIRRGLATLRDRLTQPGDELGVGVPA